MDLITTEYTKEMHTEFTEKPLCFLQPWSVSTQTTMFRSVGTQTEVSNEKTLMRIR